MIQTRPISNSQLTAFKRSPQHWWHYVNTPKKRTDAMLLGSVAHCLALQKDKLLEHFYLLDYANMPEPTKDFKTKVNREWKAEETTKAGEKEIIGSDVLKVAEKAVVALYEDKVAQPYIQSGKEFESKLEWNCLGLSFLGIRDITSDEFIVDLKFVSNADPFAFQRYLFKEGVYRQGGMYLDGEMNGEYTGDPHKRVIFIAIETDEPFGVSVHELDSEVVNFGVSEYRMLAQQLKMCIDNDYFPSYHHRSINGSFDVFLPSFIQTE